MSNTSQMDSQTTQNTKKDGKSFVVFPWKKCVIVGSTLVGLACIYRLCINYKTDKSDSSLSRDSTHNIHVATNTQPQHNIHVVWWYW